MKKLLLILTLVIVFSCEKYTPIPCEECNYGYLQTMFIGYPYMKLQANFHLIGYENKNIPIQPDTILQLPAKTYILFVSGDNINWKEKYPLQIIQCDTVPFNTGKL